MHRSRRLAVENCVDHGRSLLKSFQGLLGETADGTSTRGDVLVELTTSPATSSWDDVLCALLSAFVDT